MTPPLELDDATFRRDDRYVRRAAGARDLLVPRVGGAPPGVMLFLLDGPVASFLWEELARPRTRRELLAALLASFAVDEARAAGDLERFLDQLERAGCLSRAR